MVRISKKDRLKRCPRKPRLSGKKTGALKDRLAEGFKSHQNALTNPNQQLFIAKIK